ncbi:MAG TPA: adenylate/guanylate cyclase domain-containing protein [Bradyrhizobium sp.]|nr:adenylate/guanylate cyclase domain-containing protein [Bradyrhizobium sp.]
MNTERLERRLAAVLAADVAGYSRLMGSDELGTLVDLKAIRHDLVDPAIAAHNGRIVKTTGDGMLVEFASAVDAVTCAMVVQGQMAGRTSAMDITFRIGINIGDIIIESGDIFGDGVNIAARVENECEPGGVCLSDDAYRQVRGKTTFAFDDLGERSLKNIDRPVRIYSVRSAVVSLATGAGPPTEPKKPLLLPDRPSIAVLPFSNMSGDPEQEYFADGMVEDIITALSHFKSLFVIARNSSFTYKGRAVDIKLVGRELGVRYVLEGSVRKAGGRMRITGQLIDAVTGAHLWADKIDGALDDVFDLQDEVTTRVVGAIEPSITRAEITRAQVKSTFSLDAYDLYLRALAAHYSQTRADIDKAVLLLEEALRLDASYAWVKAFASYIHCLRIGQGWGTPEDREKATRFAREALLSGSDEPKTIAFAAHAIAWLANEHDIALAAIGRALHSNPNSFDVLIRSGWLHAWTADFDLAAEHFLRCLRLNPIDPLLGYAYCGLAFVHNLKGAYEQGAEYARLTVHNMPGWMFGWIHLAISSAYIGTLQDARAAVGRILELNPSFSVKQYRAISSSKYDWMLEKAAHGLRLAGLPE